MFSYHAFISIKIFLLAASQCSDDVTNQDIREFSYEYLYYVGISYIAAIVFFLILIVSEIRDNIKIRDYLNRKSK